MSYLEKRKSKDGSIRYRLRDTIQGKLVTVIKNVGAWKEIAWARKLDYDKQKSAGSAANLLPERRLPIEVMCDLNLEHHGSTLKGGKSDHYTSAYYGYRLRMKQVKAAWKGKYADEISDVDVSKFIAQFNTVGTRMRWIGVLGRLFRNFSKWNGKSIIGGVIYLLPAENPATKCREEMKPSEKRELRDTRVLSPDEWKKLSHSLSPRARAICEIALRRCLRLSDIRAISHLSIVDGHIQGLQAKTGEPFKVPILAGQPTKYNFTNFRRDFEQGQIKAGLHYPASHPLHFSAKDLRRTGATWAYRQTKDLVGVQKLLGHRKASTTEGYLNLSATDIQKVADAIDSTFISRGAPVENFGSEKIKGTHGG